MDLGVGAMAFTGGLVSATARGGCVARMPPLTRLHGAYHRFRCHRRLALRRSGGSFPRSSRSWATAAALLVLGLGRVLALRGVNYHVRASALLGVAPPARVGVASFADLRAREQEHVSEYGVHWNFFITLAALRGADVLTAPLPWHRLIKLSALLAAGACAAPRGWVEVQVDDPCSPPTACSCRAPVLLARPRALGPVGAAGQPMAGEPRGPRLTTR